MVSLRFGVHFSGCGVAACTPYYLLFKEPPKMVLRRMMGPSLEAGTVFDAVLSVNYCANCDSVSVIAVQEKCDEKRLGAASGRRNVRCRQFGRALFGYPLGFARGFGKTGQAFSKSARRGAPPVISCQHSKTSALWFLVKVAHPPVPWPTPEAQRSAGLPAFGFTSISEIRSTPNTHFRCSFG